MTTETAATEPQVEQTPEQKLDAAKSKANELQARFTSVMQVMGKGMGADGGDMDLTEQLALANDLRTALKAVESLEGNVREQGIHAVLNPLHETIAKALTDGNVGTLLKDADRGNAVTITATFGDTGWSINHRIGAKASTASPTPAASNGESRGRITVKTPDGEFGSKDYVFRYFADAKAAGYKSSRGSAEDIPTNEYAKIAPVMAKVLGHEVLKA